MRTSAAETSGPAVAARYRPWIQAHLAGLADGHDPFGHLFAIERLARAARADLWAARPAADRKDGP